MTALRRLQLAAVALVLVTAAGCDKRSPTAPDSPFLTVDQDVITVLFDFGSGLQNWAGEYAATYWPSTDVGVFESRLLPAPLDPTRRAFYMAGGAYGGLRLAKRRITGLPSNRTFDAVFTVEVATNTPTDCETAFGSVPVAEAFAHATAEEPVPVADSSGRLRPEWTAPGSASLGFVTSGAVCGPTDPGIWVLRSLSASVAAVTTGTTGQLWLSFQARDFSYEGLRVGRPFYLTQYRVVLTPQ